MIKPALIILALSVTAGCASAPKTEPLTLSCYAEKTHDFIAKQEAHNYWAEIVTPKTLELCRKAKYQKHTANLTQEEIKEANAWVTSRENRND